MSKQQRTYSGCSVERHEGRLRLRFRVLIDGVPRHVARALGLEDTPANHALCAPLAAVVGAAVRKGCSLDDVDVILRRARRRPAAAEQRGETVEEYYKRWVASLTGRRATLQDYSRHMEGYVLPLIGPMPIADLRLIDVRGLQRDLLARKLSVKYVRNIVGGSLRAMITDARENEALSRDPFTQLRWPDWHPPDPQPFEPAERDAIVAWFAARDFRQSDGQGKYVQRPAPMYAAFVHLLFWTGMRPSEAVALRWVNVDLARGVLFVRASRHLGETGAPKTKQARRTVELVEETVELLRALPRHASGYVFTTLAGKPIEQGDFTNSHWYDCLEELKLTKRGLYATKDTFASLALRAGCKTGWLEEQTGVAWGTLRRHYARWAVGQGAAEFARIRSFEESQSSPSAESPGTMETEAAGTVGRKAMVPRGFEPLLPT